MINPDEIRNNFFLTAQSDSSIRRIYFESCRYLARAKSFSRPEDKFLNLGIATEIALLQDDSGHRVDQLSAQFRLRGARLIGNSVEERKKVQDRLRELYNIRSQIAHTGLSSQLTKQTKNSTTDEKNSYFRGHCELTERILRVISINGFPDWEKLLLE